MAEALAGARAGGATGGGRALRPRSCPLHPRRVFNARPYPSWASHTSLYPPNPYSCRLPVPPTASPPPRAAVAAPAPSASCADPAAARRPIFPRRLSASRPRRDRRSAQSSLEGRSRGPGRRC